MNIQSRGAVERIERCRLVVGARRWTYAEEHRAEIDAHWARRAAENPRFFNGRIHLLAEERSGAGSLEGELLVTDFKSYLYWRDAGFADRSVRDAFGSALIRSADGHVLLGRQRDGNINAGLVYLPGGFIDGRDVGPDGLVDLAGSVLREVAEETGLAADDVTVQPGYWVTRTGHLVSIAVEVVSRHSSSELAGRVESYIASDPNSELTGIVMVRRKADIEGLPMPPFAPLLLEALLNSS